MDEPQNEHPRPVRGRLLSEAIRGTAFGLLIGGGLCLYFGFILVPDAPLNVSEAEQETWMAVDQGLFWSLRIVGIAFLLAAAWAATGQRASMLLATLAEATFALVMLAMSVVWTLEARATGAWNYHVILLLILLIIGVSGAKRSWSLYASAAPTAPATGVGED